LADAGVDVTGVAGGAVGVVGHDGEVEQREVETPTARGDQRPRTAGRPEPSVLGHGAGQVLWAVVTGVHLQLTDVLTRWKYRPRLNYSVTQSYANSEHTHFKVKGQGQKVLYMSYTGRLQKVTLIMMTHLFCVDVLFSLYHKSIFTNNYNNINIYSAHKVSRAESEVIY